MKDEITTKHGITYLIQGDYYIPNLILPMHPELKIGLYGRKRKELFEMHRKDD